MRTTVQGTFGPMEIQSLDSGRLQTAAPVHSSPSAGPKWSGVIKDALIRHFGSLKAAAIAMGDYDQSQLTRDLDTGKFKPERLELCDDAAKAAISAALYEAFGRTDPKARVLRLIREGRRILDELSEAIA